MDERAEWPGPADIAYQTEAQAGGFGQTLASFVKFLDLPAGAAVLDVGTGPGLAVRTVAARARLVVGSDRMPEMLRHGRRLVPAGAAFPGAWVTADALRLPFSVGAFDAVMATNLLFLLPDPPTGVAEMARVVHPGGTVGWLNPSTRLTRARAAEFAGGRGMTGFARFSLLNYGRLAEEYGAPTDEAWTEMARAAGLTDIVVECRGGGLMSLLKGRKRQDG